MDLINLYAEIVLDSAKKSPSNVILFSTPGLKNFAESALGDSIWGAHYFDEDGVVYLHGFAKNKEELDRVIHIINNVDNVKYLVNHVKLGN
jgi:hypothetical protein